MEILALRAANREDGRGKVNLIRKQRKIPAVIYGHGVESRSLAVDYLDFHKIYEKAGESTLVDLQIDGQMPIKVLIQDVQLDPLSSKYKHIDFHQVEMTEKMHADVPLKFIGESAAVKEKEGVLVKSLDKIEIECLPQDLLHEIEVDISKINTFEEVILVKDLNIPKAVTVLTNPEETVALVEQPRSEAELKSLEDKVEVTVPEEDTAETKPEGEEGDDAPVKEKPSKE